MLGICFPRHQLTTNRRTVLVTVLLAVSPAASRAKQVLCLPEGVKVGEIGSGQAVMWTRLADGSTRSLHGQHPGVAGEFRVVYGPKSGPREATEWRRITEERGYTGQVALNGLRPGSQYTYRLEARNEAGAAASLDGEFRTAPEASLASAAKFAVTTCHKFQTISDPEGAEIYESMLAIDPDFVVHTGDVVYFDKDTAPLATNVALARMHWARLYALPRTKEFHRRVGAFFIKDDHDVLKDDCWPGLTFGDLTFEQGVRLFKEHTPSGPLPYRTVRWGKDLQVWMVEGREYRSPNNMPDGPDKTIWGNEQMEWLTDGMRASDATFKVLVSATPIIGPDRDNKFDNHANANFEYEGNRVREFLAGLGNAWVVCGDRHWQFVSSDPVTGLSEYSCGPSTDSHAGGWSPEDERSEHRFLRVAGGFLSVSVEPAAAGEPAKICFRHHDTAGEIVNEEVHQP